MKRSCNHVSLGLCNVRLIPQECMSVFLTQDLLTDGSQATWRQHELGSIPLRKALVDFLATDVKLLTRPSWAGARRSAWQWRWPELVFGMSRGVP